MAQTALLVIDVQDSFLHMPYWDDTGFDDYLERLNRLIASARARNWRVVHILHERAGSPFDPAGPLVRTMAGVDRREGDAEFRKRVHNALTDSGLHQWLQEQGIAKLVIAGLRTEQCCETSTRVASDLGYEVVFVTDATHTFPMRHKGSGTVFDADALKLKTELVLEDRFARIASVADYAAATA
ncbi:isochorismatase family protein [Microbulbifer taiwanensis]|uniref:Isochorismatase family protein n=1 Tax=Microbulbifer taiwanensis TaxID=986746 RepID=A0ABW1YN41_9GAMM|nr:isochorismatase family protein [Microbulbifer taiwanensis]